jgi:hypothetical protein
LRDKRERLLIVGPRPLDVRLRPVAQKLSKETY